MRNAAQRVKELGHQDVDPHRLAQFAVRDKPWRGRCRHDGGQAGEFATRFVALAPDDAPVCLDLDLQHLAVLGAGKRFEVPPAFGAACLERNGLHDSG